MDWNMFGGRVPKRVRTATAAHSMRAATCAACCMKTTVDYDWELDAAPCAATCMCIRVSALLAGGRSAPGRRRQPESRQPNRARVEGGRPFRRATRARSSSSSPASGGSTRIPLEFGTLRSGSPPVSRLLSR